uniref:Uncharacterized protein n=1 Tax=Timema tahoe TaxID=61484 RepID=A0A7R9IC78_9NEOP|nr:unnamed protein product [Timema tahoe]
MKPLVIALTVRASTRPDNQGLGLDRPDDVLKGDDEYDAYRKRMMLAYRFRPNPLSDYDIAYSILFFVNIRAYL